ncbi:MAG: DoxX family protein [Chitinophagaceae bacterium]
MKKLNILYWVFTGLYAAVIFLTAIPNVISNADSVNLIVKQMGYPAYFVPFIGVAKCLGAIILVIPGFPRLKEWAYAGLAFDLIAAVYSFIALGFPITGWLPLLLFFVVLGCSYFFYHKRLKALSLQGAK